MSCLEAALRRNAFTRALRAEVSDGGQGLLRDTRRERENMYTPPGSDTLADDNGTEKGLTQ